MFAPNGFVLEQVCFHVVNMFARLNRLYKMYGLFLKLHSLLALAHIKALSDK